VELQVGLQEWVLTGPTRDLAAVLTGSGRRTELVEYQGGHDFAWWRGSLADGLIRWAERPDSGGASRLR
jgi:enterochelin esterase family protein